MNNGVLFVTMVGVILKVELPADNLVSQTEVLKYITENSIPSELLCIIQALLFSPMPSLGKGLVPSSWIMLHVLELNQDSGIAQVMVLRCITVSMVRTLV